MSVMSFKSQFGVNHSTFQGEGRGLFDTGMNFLNPLLPKGFFFSGHVYACYFFLHIKHAFFRLTEEA